MIKIKVNYCKSDVKSISACGHSGYADEGSDIICSAVSAVLQTACLGIEKISKNIAKISIDEKTPLLKIDIKDFKSKDCDKIQLLLSTAILGIKNIAKQNKKYLKLEEEDEIN